MIRNVHVRNFKSLKDASLKLGLRNVLVGPNMSGKSNFISLFRFLNNMVLPPAGIHGILHALNQAGGLSEVYWRGGDSNLISIAIQGDVAESEVVTENETWRYTLEIVGDKRGITVQKEELTVSGRRGERKLIGKDTRGRRRILGRRGRGASFEVLAVDAERSALEYEIPNWDGNKLRGLFASFRFYRLIPLAMKAPNTTTATNFLDERGSNLSSWLMSIQTRHPESFEKINMAVRDFLPAVENLFTWPTQQSTVFLASSERFLKSPVPVWQLADGELCFIALLSLILSPPEMGSPLFCIEEPESHLHPSLLGGLVGLLDQRQQALGKRSAQLIATTHSPEFVDKLGVDDLVVVEKRKGETVFTRPSDRRQLRALLVRKEVGLGELVYSGVLSSVQE